MDYFDFEKDFKRRISQLKLPAGAVLQVPVITAITPPLGWIVEFFLRFPDDSHIRIWESYGKIPGLYASRRQSWVYHYGPIAPNQIGPDQSLIKGTCTDPVVIRIDTSGRPLHLHFMSENPHHEQANVLGLVLEKVDCWSFIKNILKHRQTGKGVDEVFGFKIRT